jgi:protein O-mannosyl-transferase
MAAISGVLVFAGAFEHSLLSYAAREFTLEQRLLSQARILCDYLWKFLWPFGSGYGIFHDDYRYSKGLLDPSSTALAVVLIIAATALSIALLVKRRMLLLAYGVLFFLLGHSVESSVLPLELYFEHRNYLPIVGIALALAGVLRIVVRRLPGLEAAATIAIAVLVAASVARTGTLAAYWSSHGALAMTEITNHPQSARANLEMATFLARSGYPDGARQYATLAARIEGSGALAESLRSFAFYCIARQTPPEQLLAESRGAVDEVRDARASEALTVLVDNSERGLCDRSSLSMLADGFYERLVAGHPFTPSSYLLLAKIENYLARYDRAMEYAQALRSRDPDSVKANMMILYFSTILGDDANARSARDTLDRLEKQNRLGLEESAAIKLFGAGVPVAP